MAHRDIKPENFMLDKEDSLVLVDFGLAKRFESGDDVFKGTAGTVRFFAPEIVKTGQKNKVLHAKKCDIWAAGVTLYNLMTGKFPCAGDSIMEV
jgi:serine/threonine protein kinase